MEKLNFEDKIKSIPPGSICFIWGKSLLSRIIAWYERWDTGRKDLPTHCEIYFGSGKQETVSAEAMGVRKKLLNRYKKTRIEIYAYKNMTVEQLQNLKSFSYGAVGRNYDILGLISFLGKIIKKKLPQSKYANFCSEFVAEAFQHIGIEIVVGKYPYEQHPAAQWLKVVEKPTEWKQELYWNFDKK